MNVSFGRSTGLSDVGLVITLGYTFPRTRACAAVRIDYSYSRPQVLCGVKRLPVLARMHESERETYCVALSEIYVSMQNVESQIDSTRNVFGMESGVVVDVCGRRGCG